MFGNFFRDSFVYTKKYYPHILGIVVLSFIIVFIVMILLFILLMLMGLVIGVNFNDLFNNSDLGIASGAAILGFFMIVIVLFILGAFILVVFIQYPFTKTMIEITREKELDKRPFEIFLNAIKEKNFLMGLKLIALQFLMMLIIIPFVIIIGLLGFAAVRIDMFFLKAILIVLCIVGVIIIFYILLRIMFSQNVLIDKQLSVIESIKFSAAITKKNIMFILSTIIYAAIINIILQIPFSIVDTLSKNYSDLQSMMVIMGIITIITMIISFLIIPYLTIVQYLPYNMILSKYEREQSENVYILG